MKRVTGIGGIFFKCQNPAEIKAWYARHLGFKTDDYGTMFEWRQVDDPKTPAFTQWSPFAADTNYFQPSGKEFMFNYRVENLEELLRVLREEGVTVVGDMETYDYGKFGWILDPEGNKIELWEPIDQPFQDLYGEDGATK